MKHLSAFPVGFLDLVGDSDQGRNVNELSEVIVPVADMTPHYLASRQAVVPRPVVNLGGATGFHIPGALVVPDKEVWAVHNFTLLVACAPTEGVDAALMVLAPGTGIFLGPRVNTSASSSNPVLMTAQPFIALAGYSFGIYVFANNGGAPTYSGGVLASRLRA